MDNNIIPSSTVTELLCQRAKTQPQDRVYRFLVDGETQERSLTYTQLDRQARAIAAKLQGLAAPGKRALLLYPSGLDFIAAFFGCLYAGVIAVPTYPPRGNRPDPRFQAIAFDAEASVLLTTGSIASDLDAKLTPETEKLRRLATDAIGDKLADAWQMPDIQGETLAFLQYTSGSTGSPKGVMVSHGNLLYNNEMIRQGFEHTEQTIMVGWLPLFHDMGLVGNLLQPLYLGIPCILMSPLSFLQKTPALVTGDFRYRATTSGGPNFAYDLCVEKITPEQRAELDLGCWSVAFNGAEPIRAETLDRFAATFAPSGFRREAFYPCYGMAETTLFVSGGPQATPPVVCDMDRTSSRETKGSDTGSTRKVVGCGRTTYLEQKVAVVDPESLCVRPSPQEGEIWVSGGSITQGYWNRPEETRQTFQAYLADTGEGPFFRTGDLGFMEDGELFVTGRLKDLIIIRGQNYYPQDIELTVEKSHAALTANGGAAFSVEQAGEERLVVVQEVQRAWLRKLNTEEVFDAIRQAILEEYEIAVHAISLLKPGRLPKTSSGKVQRRTCREQFLAGVLESVGKWQQSEIRERAPSQIEAKTVKDWLLGRISQLTDIPPDQINTRHRFVHYGIDSVTAASLSSELSEWLGRPLPAALVYDYPNIDSLARYLSTHQETTDEKGPSSEEPRS